MRTPTLALGLLAAAAVQAAPEQPRRDLGILVYAVGGTGGIGAGIGYHFNDVLSLRGEIANLTYDDTVTESGIEWEGKLELATKGLYLDYKPFAGTFRLTAGVNLSHHGLAAVTARPDGATLELGGVETAIGAGESVSADLSYDTRPYLGIGWGLARDGFTVALDLGVEFGRPDIRLSASTNPGSPLEAAVGSGLLADEERELRSDLDQLRLFPIIKLSVGYSF
jgi:hypothetical protein